MGDCLFSDLFEDLISGSSSSPDNPFRILDDPLDKNHSTITNHKDSIFPSSILEEPLLFPSKRSASSSQEGDNSDSKKQKLSQTTIVLGSSCNGQNRTSHINVERNRRKQMNENLSVLRSLMPCFYVKRGDQASIISGVIDYIKELQQVLQSMESKKQRKIYSDVNVLSPRTVVVAASSPRLGLPLSPRLSPLSPRIPALPISPGTPTRGSSPYKPNKLQQLSNLSPRAAIVGPQFECFTPSFDGSGVTSSNTTTTTTTNSHELLSNSKSAMADVEVKFSGPNVLLKTVSNRIPGQAMKIISVLERLSLEILHVSISTIGETLINSFTIKIGIECELSAEELAQEIQQTFTSIKNGVSTITVD